MQQRDSFQKKNRRKLIWIALVILLLILIFIFASFASASSSSGSIWGRTVDQVRITVVRIGESFGLDFDVPIPGELDGELVEDGDEPGETAGLPVLPPPLEDGETAITDSVVSRETTDRGIFIVNTHLRANGNLQVSGSSDLANLNVGGLAILSELSVAGPSRMAGMISALGGIRTGGADIDLEGGQILGFDFLSGIQAGENVVISGPPGSPVISVPDIPRQDPGVVTLNGQRGSVNLVAGTDVSISGLTIANTSTLASVRGRGGCVSCLLDSDIADDLTIVGGTINDTVIGGLTPAKAYFTNVVMTGDGTPGPTLNVDGSATFTGRVSGAGAITNDDFITLGQVSELFGGVGATGVASLNSLYGALTIAGTAGQIDITSSGTTITLSLPQDISITASPTFAGLILSGALTVGGDADITGILRAASVESLDATVRKQGEEVLRASISVFPYSLPAETGSTSFTRMSKDYTAVNNPINEAPAPMAGTTRLHRMMLKYVDSAPTGTNLEWRIIDTVTSAVVHTFTTPGRAAANLEEPEIHITDAVVVPAGNWRLEVRMPAGRVRVTDIHILAFDVID